MTDLKANPSWYAIHKAGHRSDGRLSCLCHLTEVCNLVHFHRGLFAVQTLEGSLPAWVCLPCILALEMFLFRRAWSDCLQQAISIQPTPFP